MSDVAERDEWEDAGQGGTTFSFSLSFAAGECPDCGEPGEPGPCNRCGATVPDATEQSDLTRARIAAFTPLVQEVEALEEAFDHIEQGSTVLSADQFSTVVVDLGLYALMEQVAGIGHALQELDFDDTHAIGTTTRSAIRHYVDEVDRLLAVCRELARFVPEGPGAELQDITIATGRWGAGLVRSTLGALVAPTVTEARQANPEMQRFYGGFPRFDELDRVLHAVAASARPDPDSRLELVLGRAGPYSDELGFVDLPSVFAAFSRDDEPVASIDATARRYLADYIEDNELSLGAAVLLALPLVALTVLDRPLKAHRVLRGGAALLDAAYDADAAATIQILREAGADAGIVLGGVSRAQKGLRLLAMAEQLDTVDDETALAQVLNAYREIAEAPLRTYAWAFARLHGVVSGSRIEVTEPPTLGELEQRLVSSGDPLLEEVADGSQGPLRNAGAHAQYRWDSDNLEVHDLRTGQRWTLEELSAMVEDLAGVVVGLDAALACFWVRDGISSQLDNAAVRADVHELVGVLARGLFAAQGLGVISIARDLSDVVLDATRVSVSQAIPVLGGLSVLVEEGVDRIALRSPVGELLLSTPVSDLKRVAATDEGVRDIALAMLSSAIDPMERTRDQIAALMLALVVTPALVEVSHGGPDPTYLSRLIKRLQYALSVPEVMAAQGSVVRQAVSAAYQLRTGRANAARTLASRLVRLQQWAAAQGLRGFD